MLQRTGEAETITTHYLFALGIYRALYIPNWVFRYYTEKDFSDPISVIAGIIQTVLYSDFFWIYYTKSVISHPHIKLWNTLGRFPSTIAHLNCNFADTLAFTQGAAGEEVQPSGVKGGQFRRQSAHSPVLFCAFCKL